MRCALALLALPVLGSIAAADEPPPETRASVSLTVERNVAWVGETVPLTLRIEHDRDWFAEHAAPLFLRSVDVPMQVDCAAFRGLPGATVVATRAPVEGMRIALNDEVVAARESRPFLYVVRAFRFERPGRVEIPAPTLKFIHATKFQDDLVRGRTPVDPKDVVVRGQPLAIEVRPLPAEGRPADFSGGVGRFRVSSSASRSTARVGEAFDVVLTIEGEGNLDSIGTPRPVGLDGFHVFGATDEKTSAKRVVTYSVAAQNATRREVPPISFSFFDPDSGAYRIEKTVPIPLDVRPADPNSAPTAPTRPSESAPASPLRRWWPVAAAVAMVLLASAVALRARRRAARRAAAGPEQERLDRALASLHEALAHPGADLADAFAEVLAARLDCARPAVVSPDLAERLVAAGAEAGWSSRAAAALDRLDSARYGGSAPDPATISDVRDLAGGPPWTTPPLSSRR